MRDRSSPHRRRPAAAVLLAALSIGGCGAGDPSPPAGVGAPRPVGDVQRRFVEVVRSVSPAVVQIETADGLGSGVVYDRRGDIATNNHVVGGNTTFTVTLSGGDDHRASLVGTFPAGDLAVIRLTAGRAPAASFGDSSEVQPGEFVLAIGNPLGLRSSVTDGIVSSTGRTVGEGGGVVISSAIQTSAPINPGNSGGALVDLAGKVIGIPTLAATDPELGGGQAPGIGFAIPSNTVTRIADQLIASGRVTGSGRAFLDGKPTRTSDELAGVLATLRPGQRVAVRLLHPNGSRATVGVRLGETPG